MKRRPRIVLLGVLAVGLLGCSGKPKEKQLAGQEAASAEQPKAAAPAAPKAPTNPWAGLKPTLVGQHEQSVADLAFSPDGSLLASAGKDKLIKLWSLGGGAARTLSGHGAGLMMVDFSADGKLLLSASTDQTVRLWDVASGKAKRTFKDKPKKAIVKEGEPEVKFPDAIMNWAAFYPDGKKIITASDDFGLKVWDVGSGKKLEEYEDPGCRQRKVIRRKDAPGWIAAAGCMDDGITYIKLYDDNGSVVSTQGDENKDAHFLAIDRGGKFLIAADGSVAFSVFSGQGTFLKRVVVGGYHFALAFGIGDSTLLIGTGGGEVYVYRAGTWAREGKLDVGENVAVDALAVHPTSGNVVAGLRNGKILMFDQPVR